MGRCTHMGELCKSAAFWLKVLELLVGLVCVALVTGHYLITGHVAKMQTMYATIFGFFMLEVVIVLGYLLDNPIHNIVVAVICTIAAIMYIVSGGLLLEVWKDLRHVDGEDNVLVAGILSLFNGLVFAVDVILTLKKCRNDRMESA